MFKALFILKQETYTSLCHIHHRAGKKMRKEKPHQVYFVCLLLCVCFLFCFVYYCLFVFFKSPFLFRSSQHANTHANSYSIYLYEHLMHLSTPLGTTFNIMKYVFLRIKKQAYNKQQKKHLSLSHGGSQCKLALTNFLFLLHTCDNLTITSRKTKLAA